jgi:membrane-associated protease RseP (regulator of RpoE activity)
MPPAFELMHYPALFVGYLTCFFTALNLLPMGQLDGGHVTYGLFGRRVAGRVSRIVVILLLLMGGTGVMRLETYDPAYFGEPIWYALDQGVEMLMCLGLYAFVLGRIFPHLPWLRIAGLALALGGFQYCFNLLIGPVESNPIWLVYAFLAVRVLGVDHPEAFDDRPLSKRQRMLGYLAILIFILCFSPAPLIMM